MYPIDRLKADITNIVPSRSVIINIIKFYRQSKLMHRANDIRQSYNRIVEFTGKKKLQIMRNLK